MTDRELLDECHLQLSMLLDDHVPIIAALRSRLAQYSELDEAIAAGDGTLHGAIDYWQSKAQSEWQGLTDEEVIDAANAAPFATMVTADDFIFVLGRAIEAKLREKNLG